MQMKALRGAVLAAVAGAVLMPGVADAAQVTVTSDAGSPVALNPAAPTALRNADITVTVNKEATESTSSYSILTKDPTGAIAGDASNYCWTINGANDYPKYRGNGTYTVIVQFHSGDCSTPIAKTIQEQYTIGAGVAMSAPPSALLTRAPNTSVLNRYDLPIALNPGMGNYEVRYASGAVIAPDGSISGPSSTAFVDTSRGTVSASFERPGTYTFVARGSADDYFTPWSTPMQLRTVSPFDFAAVNGLTFPDRRGPSYKLRAQLRERSATGRVYISYARGSKSGAYRSLGYSRISKAGTISRRFRLRKTGTYRLRFRFKGSTTTAAGDIRTKIRITRRVVF
jgi:hypothetical protein